MATPTLGDRIAQAILAYQSQIGRRVTYAEVGEAVARTEGREKPYTAAAVSEWIQGRGEPRLGAVKALAQVLRVPAGWLAFGDIPAEPDMPVQALTRYPVTRRGQPAEEVLAATKKAAPKKAGGEKGPRRP